MLTGLMGVLRAVESSLGNNPTVASDQGLGTLAVPDVTIRLIADVVVNPAL